MYGRGVDFVGLVVIEENRSLKVAVPRYQLIDCHVHWRLGGPETVVTGEMAVSAREIAKQKRNAGIAYSAIWLVETLIPLHNSIMRPVNAIETRSLVRVKRSRTVLHGGRRALADFHVTPPLGKSILYKLGGRKNAGRRGRDVAASATRFWRKLRQSGGDRTSVSVCSD